MTILSGAAFIVCFCIANLANGQIQTQDVVPEIGIPGKIYDALMAVQIREIQIELMMDPRQRSKLFSLQRQMVKDRLAIYRKYGQDIIEFNQPQIPAEKIEEVRSRAAQVSAALAQLDKDY